MTDDYDFSHVSALPLSRGGSSSGSDGMSFISRLGTSSIHRPWTTSTRASVSSRPHTQAKINISRDEPKPADMIKTLERQINSLLEESILLKQEKKLEEALDKAKEAVTKEQLMRKHDKSRPLMFSTLFNLASVYEANAMYDKALKTYSIFFKKQRAHPFAGRLRISMGNIYYAQHDYPSAIKCYEMALDQLSRDDPTIHSKLRWNIANACFRSGRPREAIKKYQALLDSNLDYQTAIRTGFNLFLCHYALGDEDAMRQDLINLAGIHEEDSVEDDLVDQINGTDHHYLLLTAARLLSSSDVGTETSSYDWVCNVLEEANHENVATHLELEQAIESIKRKEFDVATQMLKELQQKCKAIATTNLSFLSFLAGDSDKASQYADIAIEADRYNAKALVNKANSFFFDGDFDSAKKLYLEATDNEADCFESMHSLGLLSLSQGDVEHALVTFAKLHKLTPNNPEVIYQIADIHDLQGRSKEAIKWFSVLIARIPNDPYALSRLGQIYLNVNENPEEALHFKLESFRNFPLEIDLIIELGTTFVKDGQYKKSIYFFQQAALIQPNEERWERMVASALRRVEECER